MYSTGSLQSLPPASYEQRIDVPHCIYHTLYTIYVGACGLMGVPAVFQSFKENDQFSDQFAGLCFPDVLEVFILSQQKVIE